MQKEYSQFVKGVIDPQTTFDLVVGRTRLLVLAETPQRIQVGDERTLTCERLAPAELSLKALAIGTTVLNLWFADPQEPDRQKILSYLVRVYPDPQTKERLQDDFQALAAEINRAFPDSKVSLATVGDKVAVSGQARDASQAAEILRFVGHVFNVPGTTGTLETCPTTVVNLLHSPCEHQVQLRVTVAEVNRAAARSIGLNCGVEHHDGTTIFATRTGQLSGLTNMGGVDVPVFLDDGQIGLAIHALREMNLAKALAEPKLVVLEGHLARFDTGGKFPVPSGKGVDFVPYGVSLQCTSNVLDGNCIRLAVQAEVSTRDDATTVNVCQTPVPGLNSRTFQTTVELREGQTLAVAGLIQNSFAAASQHSQGWCDCCLGRLRGSDVTSTSEQELIVLITPELVHPQECKEVHPVPGENLIRPSDLEFYLMGHWQGQGPDGRKPGPVDSAQMKRLNHCEELFIAGPQGFSNGRE